MSQSNATTTDLVLSCTPEKVEDRIVFAYEIANRGTDSWYVMDALVGVDWTTRKARLEPGAATIWQGGDGYAHVLVGLAPVPTDRNIAMRVFPVSVALAPQATLRRKLELRLPLAEQSPYYPLGNLRDYRMAEIAGITLLVDALPASAAGLVLTPSGVSPEHVQAMSADTVRDLRRLRVSFRAQGLQLMTRTDAYPRPD
jgi:hypothetical protein